MNTNNDYAHYKIYKNETDVRDKLQKYPQPQKTANRKHLGVQIRKRLIRKKG